MNHILVIGRIRLQQAGYIYLEVGYTNMFERLEINNVLDVICMY